MENVRLRLLIGSAHVCDQHSTGWPVATSRDTRHTISSGFRIGRSIRFAKLSAVKATFVRCPPAHCIILMDFVRGLVSKKKKRFVDASAHLDLDLSYITPRLIAMGLPSEGFEASYRNSAEDVHRFFELRHPSRYMVVNLCSEKSYSATIEKIFPSRRIPWADHNAPPLRLMRAFCLCVDEFLLQDPRNVVAVHCKAGKGRTGTAIACYLLHSGACRTAAEALHFFAFRRTLDGKGVTIPSQIRFVHYYE